MSSGGLAFAPIAWGEDDFDWKVEAALLAVLVAGLGVLLIAHQLYERLQPAPSKPHTE